VAAERIVKGERFATHRGEARSSAREDARHPGALQSISDHCSSVAHCVIRREGKSHGQGYLDGRIAEGSSAHPRRRVGEDRLIHFAVVGGDTSDFGGYAYPVRAQ
jgi:hypothetical protein